MSFATMLTANIKKPLSKEVLERMESTIMWAKQKARRVQELQKIVNHLNLTYGNHAFVKTDDEISFRDVVVDVKFEDKFTICLVGNYGNRRRCGGHVNGYKVAKVADVIAEIALDKLAERQRVTANENRRVAAEQTMIALKEEFGTNRWSGTIAACSGTHVGLHLTATVEQARQLLALAKTLGIDLS